MQFHNNTYTPESKSEQAIMEAIATLLSKDSRLHPDRLLSHLESLVHSHVGVYIRVPSKINTMNL